MDPTRKTSISFKTGQLALTSRITVSLVLFNVRFHSWHKKFVAVDDGRGILVSPLEPGSYYAFYLETYVINHQDAVTGRSKVVVEATEFGGVSECVQSKE